MKAARFLLIVLVAVPACGSKTPQTPTVPGGSGESITGRERIGWNQPAGDVIELVQFGWAVYTDGNRAVLSDVTCGATAQLGVFDCSGGLPALSAGAHTLELASFLLNDRTVESARSSPLRVTVVAAVPGPPAPDWQSGAIETAADGTRLRIDRLVDGLQDPTDAALAPDGRLLITERTGRVTVVEADQSRASSTALDDVVAGGLNGLLGIAIDPKFERTHFVFVVYTAQSSEGRVVFRLARYRELQGSLAERAVLLEGAAASTGRAAAALRFGPDGTLFLAMDDGGDPSTSLDPSSYSGKVLRLTDNGSTPKDQASPTPIFASGVHSPRGLGFDPGSGLMWLADAEGPPADRLKAIAIDGDRPLRSSVRTIHDLKTGSAGAIALVGDALVRSWRNDLLMASEEGRAIAKIRFSQDNPAVIAASERLLADRVGPIRVVVTGPDGAIYFCTTDALGRLDVIR
jgi:glucose/arabinose dehydrogenase